MLKKEYSIIDFLDVFKDKKLKCKFTNEIDIFTIEKNTSGSICFKNKEYQKSRFIMIDKIVRYPEFIIINDFIIIYEL